MQRGQSVCSEVGPCAARLERVQRGRSVCSEVGACAARSERVQRGLVKKIKKKLLKRSVPPLSVLFHDRYKNFIK